MDLNNRLKQSQRISLITIVLNCILFLCTAAAGIIAQNLSVISDAAHSLSDILSTVVAVIGIRLSTAKPDRFHNYGHSKLESVFSKILALFLVATAIGIGIGAYNDFVFTLANPEIEKISMRVLLIVITSLSIVSKEIMYWYTLWFAKKLNSTALKADAWHHRSDSISSIAVLIGLVFSMAWNINWMQSIASGVVALLILRVGVGIYIDGEKQMVDTSASEQDCEEIKKTILAVDGVLRLDTLKTRISGAFLFVDVEIACDAELHLHDAHTIAENVEKAILDKHEKVRMAAVHVNPVFTEENNLGAKND